MLHSNLRYVEILSGTIPRSLGCFQIISVFCIALLICTIKTTTCKLRLNATGRAWALASMSYIIGLMTDY